MEIVIGILIVAGIAYIFFRNYQGTVTHKESKAEDVAPYKVETPPPATVPVPEPAPAAVAPPAPPPAPVSEKIEAQKFDGFPKSPEVAKPDPVVVAEKVKKPRKSTARTTQSTPKVAKESKPKKEKGTSTMAAPKLKVSKK